MSTAALLQRLPQRRSALAVQARQAAALAAYLLVAGSVGAWLLEGVTRPAASGEPRDWALPLWTILVGLVVNATCALLGCYLVLRRMSLLGDAISHAVLPGIALAYYFTGSVSGWPIFVGALVLGLATSALAQAISSLGRVSEDSSLGVVFTSLFALGVIMLQLFARHADLDADCVFYGQIDFVSADLVEWAGWTVSRPLLTLVPVLAAALVFVLVLWKELKLVAFDPVLAAAMGFRVAVVHYLLMAMVAGATVAAFESVGAILVVAMLIVPAATAALVAERLGWMLAWAVAFGATSAIYGYWLAAAINTSVAGAMAVVAGVQFTAAVFIAPRQGILSRWLRNQALSVRIAAEDLLGGLYRAEEAGALPSAAAAPPAGSRRRAPAQAPPLVRWLASWRLWRQGWIVRGPEGDLALTGAGRSAARGLVRAHRLWESYLDAHFDLPRDHLHDAAERMEHYLDPELADELAAELADRSVDPHGKAIPTVETR
jgi:ABC-type Mn2+/Zn2+ transport system permease subunit